MESSSSRFSSPALVDVVGRVGGAGVVEVAGGPPAEHRLGVARLHRLPVRLEQGGDGPGVGVVLDVGAGRSRGAQARDRARSGSGGRAFMAGTLARGPRAVNWNPEVARGAEAGPGRGPACDTTWRPGQGLGPGRAPGLGSFVMPTPSYDSLKGFLESAPVARRAARPLSRDARVNVALPDGPAQFRMEGACRSSGSARARSRLHPHPPRGSSTADHLARERGRGRVGVEFFRLVLESDPALKVRIQHRRVPDAAARQRLPRGPRAGWAQGGLVAAAERGEESGEGDREVHGGGEAIPYFAPAGIFPRCASSYAQRLLASSSRSRSASPAEASGASSGSSEGSQRASASESLASRSDQRRQAGGGGAGELRSGQGALAPLEQEPADQVRGERVAQFGDAHQPGRVAGSSR